MHIPSSKIIKTLHYDFLQDMEIGVTGFIKHAYSDSELRTIFKLYTACYRSLRGFLKPPRTNTADLVEAAAGSIRRSCFLSMLRQVNLIQLELRRTIECVFWDVYFIDHPVEFEHFRKHPERRAKDGDDPIAAAAGGPIGFFARYAIERMTNDDASGIAMRAATTLRSTYGDLSVDIHAAKGAVSSSMALAHDRYDHRIAAQLRKLHAKVLKSVALIVAANDPRRLNLLSDEDRAWFDSLVGAKDAKVIAKGNFGLSRQFT